ncbi:MAG: MoxR family ATPase, partial [Chloroflexi bacterium]|nr:MoxR family ATPase [Chloroflexota bacterium]
LEGTFPLPEAQLDRFLLRLRMGYPSKGEDLEILARFRERNPIEDLEPVVSSEELLEMQAITRRVLMDPDLETYIVDLVHATREHPEVELGASPRAMLALYRTGQALAAVRGRSYVTPDDLKYLAPFVFEHRIIAKSQSHLRGLGSAEILREVVDSVAVPAEQLSERR